MLTNLQVLGVQTTSLYKVIGQADSEVLEWSLLDHKANCLMHEWMAHFKTGYYSSNINLNDFDKIWQP